MRVGVVGETPSLTGESTGETHRVLEQTQAHLPRNQHQKGYNPLVGSKGSDRKWGKSQASSIVNSVTSLPHTVPQHSKVGCPILVNTQDSAP